MDRTTGIIVSVLALAIVAVAGWVFGLGKDVGVLQADFRNMKQEMQEVANDVSRPRDVPRTAPVAMTTVVLDGSVLILPLAGWLPQGPGAKDLKTHDETIAFDVELKGPDDYAEMFLDLRSLTLDGLNQNADGSYNLAGVRITANLRTERDFVGDPHHPNGVQFLLKDAQSRNSVGRWHNISSRIATPEGMDVSLVIPDNAVAQNTAAITLKLTIGSSSDAEFRGTIYVKDIKITKAD